MLCKEYSVHGMIQEGTFHIKTTVINREGIWKPTSNYSFQHLIKHYYRS